MKYLRLSFFFVTMTIHLSVYSQEQLDLGGSNTLYDIANAYINSDNPSLPDSLKEPVNKEYERMFKLWGPRLFPHGDFSKVQQAHREYAISMNGMTAQSDLFGNHRWTRQEYGSA